MFFLVIRNFNLSTIRDGWQSANNVYAHSQVVENVDAVKSLLDNDAMSRLRKVQSRREIKLSSFRF